MAKLIVYEGADHCGKSTQSKMLEAHLKSIGYKVAHVKAPINDVITYKIIYWMLKNGLASQYPGLFQTIQYINKRVFQEFKLKRLEKNNDYIVFDRWRLSALVYGNASGIENVRNQKLYHSLREPDVTVLLLGNPLTNDHDDKYESDEILQSNVRKGYSQWAFSQPSNKAIVVSSGGLRSKIHGEIIEKLEELNII